MGLILIKFLELTIIVISLERLKLAVESWVGREMEERKLKSQFRWELIHGIKLWGFFLPICVLSCFCLLLPASLHSIYSAYWQTLEPYVLASVKVHLLRKQTLSCSPGIDLPAPEVLLQASDVL